MDYGILLYYRDRTDCLLECYRVMFNVHVVQDFNIVCIYYFPFRMISSVLPNNGNTTTLEKECRQNLDSSPSYIGEESRGDLYDSRGIVNRESRQTLGNEYSSLKL